MAARISKDVSAKIRETAHQLNYQPNQIAKSLKTQKTNTIGLIVADIANPFSAQIARIIEDAAKQQGYTVIFGSSDENIIKAQDLINTMLNRQVDGLIIAAVDKSETQLHQIVKAGVPLVLIDRYFPDERLNYIGIDNFAATFDAVNMLVGKGRKRIGLVTYQTGLFHVLERNRGFSEALTQAGMPADESLIRRVSLQNIRDGVEKGLEAMLNAPQPIDAVLFTTNILALNGLRYLKNVAADIPEKLAVVAFDEADCYDFFPVSITHIRQPLEELGKTAMNVILNQINGQPESPVRINLNTQLILGESSG